RDVQQLGHALARDSDVGSFLRRFGFDGFGERSRLVTRQDHRKLLREFGFKRGQYVRARQARRLQVAGAAERRTEAAAFVPTGSDEIAGFDFHVHDEREYQGAATASSAIAARFMTDG